MGAIAVAQRRAGDDTSLSLRQERAELNRSIDVVQGTLDLLILKALSLDPVHAWGISARIQTMSGDAFQIGQGSLYPAMHRLENRGWVNSHWRTTENNRIARYYDLTPAGRHALAEEIAHWRACIGALGRVIDARKADPAA